MSNTSAVLVADRPSADSITERLVVFRTRGNTHGAITRLMSPGDLGEHLKPFVFLDLFEMDIAKGKGFAPHPHSGLATLTVSLEGRLSYADSTGKSGVMVEKAVEWMRAGRAVWHTGNPVQGLPNRGYQLWLALPPELELAEPESLYINPEAVEQAGPARVVLGSYQGKTSPIKLDTPVTYLHVNLADGERWSYEPDPSHDVAWLALNKGRVHTAGAAFEREMVVFAEGSAPIHLLAEGEVELVIGSAAKHPHPLVTGYYSVHTSKAALNTGEAAIAAMQHTPQVKALNTL